MAHIWPFCIFLLWLILKHCCVLQEAVRQVEVRVIQHEAYDEAVEQFTPWLDEAVRKLHGLHDSTGSKEQLQDRLTQLKVGWNFGL